VNRAVAILILIVVLCVGGLFLYFKFGGATLINKDLSTLVLSSEDVMYPLLSEGYQSVEEVADAFMVSEYQLEQWGYNKGYASFFGSPERPMVASGAYRFLSVDGAISAFHESESKSSLNPKWEKLTSEKHILSILSVEISGYERSTWRYYSDGDTYYSVTFRKANIIVGVNARSLQNAEMYARILEERI